jgi:hypothetical protein
MRWWLVAVAIMMAGALVLPREAAAKGQDQYLTFRLSGGDLPHTVTVSLVESTLTKSGLGNWYQRTNLAEPPASAIRYSVDEVDAKDPAGPALQTWLYVPGTPPLVHALLGGGETAGWAEPAKPIGDLLDRYIVLARQGRLAVNPNFGKSLQASLTLPGNRASVGGKDLPVSRLQRFVSLLGQAEPVYFGVRGNLIGQRDLHQVEVRLTLGGYDITFAYVPPGPVAPYGLLFSPGAVGSWDYITLLSPPSYAQLAYRVPPEFERMMSDLGFPGTALQEVVEVRSVPLLQAGRNFGGTDRIEVWKGSGDHQVLRPTSNLVCAYESGQGIETAQQPLATEALNVAVWPTGVEPFPAAVRPSEYKYYPAESTASGRGILVEVQPGAVYNGFSAGVQPPCYADPALAALLQNAARAIGLSRGAPGAAAAPVSSPDPAKTFGVVLAGGMSFLILVAGCELLRRRFSIG